ncbi:TOBE domain-containing protein [Neorhizobium galegae]|uniref:TOBE domain-containing protein n=2 Tax=Neorhizobium galegae TaxID=399 RepID=UPI002107BD82|nr:TOBE domain-containing protein [Neorhizobium galegae]
MEDAFLEGVIDVVEPTGPDTMVTAIIGNQTVIARAEPRFKGRRGDQIRFKVDPSSINLLDAKTEARIDIGDEPPVRIASV